MSYQRCFRIDCGRRCHSALLYCSSCRRAMDVNYRKGARRGEWLVALAYDDPALSAPLAIDRAALCTADGRIFAVPRPLRHDAIFRHNELSPAERQGAVQGFLTTDGRFVDRLDAYEIADRAGQIVRDVPGEGLFTEHLW